MSSTSTNSNSGTASPHAAQAGAHQRAKARRQQQQRHAQRGGQVVLLGGGHGGVLPQRGHRLVHASRAVQAGPVQQVLLQRRQPHHSILYELLGQVDGQGAWVGWEVVGCREGHPTRGRCPAGTAVTWCGCQGTSVLK